MSTISIYTDGSCQTQTRLGGWAAVLTSGTHRKVLSGSAVDTTVNAMDGRSRRGGMDTTHHGWVG